MKKFLFFIVITILSFFISNTFWLEYFDTDSSNIIREDNVNKIVNTDWVWLDPLRNWTTNVWTQMNGTINAPITTSTEAQAKTTILIRNVVNYFLGFLWLVALIYLVYNWFGILSAWWDDAKSQKWYKWLNYSLYALLWVGFTWILISFALYLVDKFFITS